MPPPSHGPAQPPVRDVSDLSEDSIDLRELFVRLGRGIPQIIGFAFVGLAIAALCALLLARFEPVATTTRVVFSFPGFERGEYPDKSKFQPDDLRAPSIVAESLRRQGLDTSSDFQSKIRGALSIEGIIPPNIVKDRDRLRAAGQNPPVYIPDEYAVTLSLPRTFGLSDPQREHLISEIISIYRENFTRTYANVPIAFGSAFATLRDADFPEYQLILDKEIEGVTSYLEQLLSKSTSQKADDKETGERSASFRSLTTNLSFKDLLEQTELFSQIRLSETLGLIHQNGLSKDRSTALVKMDYYLRTLENQERRAVEEEKVIRDLLAQSQERTQNYVLGIKSQATQARTEPILDQGLIDSLLANDAYNFLVRRALDAGLQVKRIQAEKARLLELRENMKSFTNREIGDQAEIIARVDQSLQSLEVAYKELVDRIRKTQEDFARQQYADAIRISNQVKTEGVLRPVAVAGIVGGLLGMAVGAGLSLLGFTIGARRTA